MTAAPLLLASLALIPRTPSGPVDVAKIDISKPEKVTVALDWTPNTNHTGLYVAKAKGAFKAMGLDVSFVQPAQTTSTALVAAGKADFGVSFTNDVINARAGGLPVVSVAAIVQENTSCFAWRAGTGIKGVKDWEGKRYGGWGAPEEEQTIRYLMKRAGADFSKVNMVVSGVSDFVATTSRAADFMWIYMGWDGMRAKLAGVKFETLCLKDLDPAFNHHSPLLVAGEKTLAAKPALAGRFLLAASYGYGFASKDPTAAAGILLKEVPELDAKLVGESASFLAKEYARGVDLWGFQDGAKWGRYLDWARAQGLAKGSEPAGKHFTNGFLPDRVRAAGKR